MNEHEWNPQERYAAECAAKDAVQEWKAADENKSFIELAITLNDAIAKAVRSTRESKADPA